MVDVPYVINGPFVSKSGTFRGEWLEYSASMPRAMSRAVFFVLLAAILPVAPAGAQSFETAGARALGMGGAFVGVADDTTAIWWNPAGLATGAFFGLAVERHAFEQRRPDLSGSPPPARRSSFFLGAGSLPLGLSYVRTRETFMAQGPADEAVLRDLVTHQAGVTVLQSLSDAIVIAGTAKYMRGTAAAGPPGVETDGQAGNAFDADLAVMVHTGGLKAGLTLRNVASPEFEARDGSRIELPWRARAGVSYLASEALTLALDVDLRPIQIGEDRRRSLALGGEGRIGGSTRVVVRSGARFDTIGRVNPLGTVGGSYAVRNGVWVDVWAAAGAREADRGWGLAGRILY
jgi:hypothetical protein